MKITQLHAHFLVSIGRYSNERIGFSVTLDENETPEGVVPALRDRVRSLVGKPADDLYEEKYALEQAIKKLETELQRLRTEWDATADFLRAQGLNPKAPQMPIFHNLLVAARVESESVFEEGEIVEDIVEDDDKPF